MIEAGATAPDAVAEVLAALASGGASDEDFRRLFLLYHRAVHGFFARCGYRSEDCQDLTQETFLGIFRGIGSFRLGEPFEPWLFAIAANVDRKRRRFRAAGRRRGSEISLDADGERELAAPELVELGGPEVAALRNERVRLLWDAVGRLPEQMRRCLVLRCHAGLKVQEIAALMGRSIDTVKTHLAHARRRLKAELGDGAEWREVVP